jgi:hypothetical protein
MYYFVAHSKVSGALWPVRSDRLDLHSTSRKEKIQADQHKPRQLSTSGFALIQASDGICAMFWGFAISDELTENRLTVTAAVSF